MRSVAQNSAGFSLAEVLVAMILTSTTILAAGCLLDFTITQANNFILLQTRDKIQSELTLKLADLETISASRNYDRILNSCFLGGSLRSTCPGQYNTGVSVRDKSGTILSGSPDSPLYLTSLGAPCQWPSSKCQIKITTYVYAQGVPRFTDNILISNQQNDFGNEILEIHFEVSIINNTRFYHSATGMVIYDIDDYLESAQITD